MVALALWHMTLQPREKMPILVRRDFQITNAAFGREVEGEGRSVVIVQHQPINPRYLGSESGSDYDSDEEFESDEELDSEEEAADEAELAGETSKLSNGSAGKKGGKKVVAAEEDDEEDDEDMDEDDEDEDDFDSEDDEDFQPHVEAVVCSLIPGKIEQASLNLTFVKDEVVVFEVTGSNVVHLMGNYIDQSEHNHGHGSDDEDDDEDSLDYGSEDEYGGEDDEEDEEELTSEQEAELRAYFALKGEGKKGKNASRIELLDSDDKKPVNELPTKKRKAETQNPDDSITSTAKSAISTAASKVTEVAKNVTDAVTGAAAVAGKETKEMTKTEKKKLNKKLKAESGKGVEADVSKVKEAAPAAAPAKEEKKEQKGPTKKTLAGGLIVEDIKVGDGQIAKKGKKLGMRYIGKLLNGKQFDANTSGKAFDFRLGTGEVIKGWDQGLVGMAVGGERRLTIPAGLAYGSQKISGIPPNSTLTFDVKLLSVK